MLTITATATEDLYTTASRVKEVLGITETSDDSYISHCIAQASRWADSYVGYPISRQAYRESLSGYGGRRMMLSRKPVAGVESFWDATDTGTATTILSSEFRLDQDAGFIDRNAGFEWDAPAIPNPLSLDLTAHYFSGQEESPWLADYIAGFTYSGLDTGSAMWTTKEGTTSTGRRTLPEDIERAVILKALSLYQGEETVTERWVGDLKVKYATASDGNLIRPEEELLAPYRSVV